MLKFLGISKRKKINKEEVVSLYISTLNEVINNGFIEIKNFINENNNLESKPSLKDSDIKWFSLIIILANLYNLKTYFEEEEVIKLRACILDNVLITIDSNIDLAMEKFLSYEDYFSSLIMHHEDLSESMAIGIFEKYNINKFQGDLFKRKNKPNPIFLHELKNLLNHFIWNWEDYLKEYRITY